MIQQGTILAVEVETLGAELSADVAVGASVLPLGNVIDFTDLGGSLTIGTETFTFLGTGVDDVNNTVTIQGTLANAYTKTTFVYLAPAPVVRYWAHVQIDGDDDEAILAEVSRPMALQLNQGVRDITEQETAAILDETDGTWTLRDVLGLEPSVIGTSIYVPDPEDPNFAVDENGILTAAGVTIYPASGSNIPLIIKDTLGVGGDWTQWQDSGGIVIARITRLGAFRTSGDILSQSQIGINAVGTALPTTNLRLDNGVGATGALVFAPANGTADFALYRSGSLQATFGQVLGSTAFDLIVQGNVHAWYAYYFGGSGGAEDTRIRRSNAKELSIEDAGGGAADLVITGKLTIIGNYWDFVTNASPPAAPNPGRLRFYVTNDGSNHPQFRVRNSAGSVNTMTTFTDGA